MTLPRDFSALRRFVEAQTGVLCGFTTDLDRARFPYVVTLDGLCAEILGHRNFCEALHRCVHVAVELAPLKFRHAAYYEHHQRTGYRFIFESPITAIQFGFHCEVARPGITVKFAGPRMVTPDETPATP